MTNETKIKVTRKPWIQTNIEEALTEKMRILGRWLIASWINLTRLARDSCTIISSRAVRDVAMLADLLMDMVEGMLHNLEILLPLYCRDKNHTVFMNREVL